MSNHDYSLHGGFDRVKVARYLTLVATSASGVIVFLLLSTVDLAKRSGLNVNLPPTILSLVGAGMVFAALYWIFNRYVWRWPHISKALKVPNLTGEWACAGQSLNQDGTPSYEWQGSVVIFQSWDKIQVRLKTAQSTSDSVAAALICDDEEGYRLLYNYRNDPKIGEVDLKSHLGSCMLLFAKDLQSAQGEYFNGRGRYSFGTLNLSR
jgi:hypothetical protein